MGYKSCAAKIAASIKQDCNRPLVGGYTGRAVIMSVTDFERAEVVRSATNPREILSVVLPPDGSVMAYTVDNVFAAPFTGSTTAGNNDDGRNGYLKTLNVRVPMRGADTSMKVIEPLVKDPNGFVAAVEKRDKVGDGSYEVIGYQNALRGDIAGVTRDESTNGGDWIVPLTTVEKWAEVTLVGAGMDYVTAKKNFDELQNFETGVMTFVSEKDDEAIILSANGVVYIDSVKNGENVRQVLYSPNNLSVSISNDANTEIVIYGAVYDFKAMYYTGARISSINTSGNNALKVLEIQNNTGLNSLDLSKNTLLTSLNCNSCTSLNSLDVSKNTALTSLDCSGCTGLNSLDVSNNTLLTSLNCYGCTGLNSLDVSNNTLLTSLNCNSCTSLNSLDVSKNTALTSLDCYGCTGLNSLDVSNNTLLTSLYCNDCTGLNSLDVSNNTLLTSLYCNGCTGLNSLDLSKNTALTSLDCSGCTGLMLLDIQNTSALEGDVILDQSMANLTTLQVAGTSAWAYEQVESWLSDFAPDNGKVYVDENTPQGVITAAEGKSWEVVYVS